MNLPVTGRGKADFWPFTLVLQHCLVPWGWAWVALGGGGRWPIRHIAMAVVYEAYRMLDENHIPDVALSGKERLFRDFLALVKDNYKTDKTIAPYAKRLCISTKYLSLLTKELSGKTASYWIDQYVMLEARSLLSSTNLTIKQIAFELGFSSQSFFGKYFSRMEGVSPKKFRSR